jgi:hypothetical protein
MEEVASETCTICNARKARRTCPVKGEICPQCCGREREETIDCPMDCSFLIESRMHSKSNPIDLGLHKDVRVTEEFVGANHGLFVATCMALLNGVLEVAGCVDNDIQDCLDAVIRNRKTRESGLYYDGKPDNRIAAQVMEIFEGRLADFRKESVNWAGFTQIKDSDELRMLVFIRSLEGSHNNGRRKSRAFIHFLYGVAAQQLPPEEESGGGEQPRLIQT